MSVELDTDVNCCCYFIKTFLYSLLCHALLCTGPYMNIFSLKNITEYIKQLKVKKENKSITDLVSCVYSMNPEANYHQC